MRTVLSSAKAVFHTFQLLLLLGFRFFFVPFALKSFDLALQNDDLEPPFQPEGASEAAGAGEDVPGEMAVGDAVASAVQAALKKAAWTRGVSS